MSTDEQGPAREIPVCIDYTNVCLFVPLGEPEMSMQQLIDGTWRWRHLCDRGERGVIICAPRLSPGHQVVQIRPLTIQPSILCPDCGTHGYVRNDRWEAS